MEFMYDEQIETNLSLAQALNEKTKASNQYSWSARLFDVESVLGLANDTSG